MDQRVAILMYHDVSAGDPSGSAYTVSRGRLARDLALMRQPGVVPVEVTFDDGHAGTFIYGMPALLEGGVVARLFVTTGFLGQPGFMDVAMLRAWHGGGQRVGSHAVTHRPLTALSKDELRREILDSKARLEDLLGAPVEDFAFPGGNEDARVRAGALEHYAHVYTSRPGFARPGERLLPRFAMRETTAAHAVRALREGRTGSLFLGDRVRWAAKRTLGARLYVALRALVRPALVATAPDARRGRTTRFPR